MVSVEDGDADFRGFLLICADSSETRVVSAQFAFICGQYVFIYYSVTISGVISTLFLDQMASLALIATAVA